VGDLHGFQAWLRSILDRLEPKGKVVSSKCAATPITAKARAPEGDAPEDDGASDGTTAAIAPAVADWS